MSSNLLAILALCCAVVATCCSGNSGSGEPPSLQLAGGEVVKPGKYPFMALIKVLEDDKKWVYKCGGTVLDDQHILTAANCLMKRSQVIGGQKLQVHVGCHDELSTCVSTHEVSKVMVHHEYNRDRSKIANNIGVLKLRSKIKFNKIAGVGAVGKVELASRSDTCCDQSKNKLKVIGWSNFDNLGTPSRFLHEARIDSILLSRCRSMFKGSVDQTMICAGDSARTACGDVSGIPLLMTRGDGTEIQVGVVTIGSNPCGSMPSVATKVASFREWVDECLSDKGCKTR